MKIDYEAVVEIINNFLSNKKVEILGISVGEEFQLRQAIENLIRENEELHREINQRIKLKLENERCADKDFIPKSKIEEIVDLYDNTLQCTRKYNQELADILCDLQELLEESEK